MCVRVQVLLGDYFEQENMRGSPTNAKRNKQAGIPQKGDPGYRGLETMEESLAHSIFRANKKNTRVQVRRPRIDLAGRIDTWKNRLKNSNNVYY